MLLNLVRVVLRMVDSDQSNIEYLLQAGLNDYLVAILQWNNPIEDVDNQFSLELDTLVNSIVFQIVKSNVREYGNTLIDGGQQWILDRFTTRMVHTDLRAKYHSMILLLALLR